MQHKEVKIKPGIKRLNGQIEDVITVTQELAKPGVKLNIDGVDTKVLSVLEPGSKQ